MSAVRDSKTAPTHGDPPASASRVGERIQSYILDGRDEDLRRLLRISQVTAQTARAGLRRAGLEQGWRVIDCGYGPIGALAAQNAPSWPGAQARSCAHSSNTWTEVAAGGRQGAKGQGGISQ